ncbi:MAG TPA: zf-HC2 domain-containing protein [Gemmatimonadales bacterium]|nr:zf-HC2 domain-containing protein [Gemmatimonadales bacterium]
MSHPDDGRLHALVDGELSPADAAAIEAHVQTCQPCRVRLDEARMLLGESDRIVARLDLEPRRAPRATGGGRRFDVRVLGLAASALLVVTVGYLALRPDRGVPAASPVAARAAESVNAAPKEAAPAPATSAEQDVAPPRAAPEPERRPAAERSLAQREEAKPEAAPAAPTAGRMASRADAAEQRVASDTPPTRAADGVALNDLPPWKAKVAAPSPPPPSARFRLEGLDVVSSQPLPGGGIRLVYSVNGTPVEFDQVPASAAAQPAPTAGAMRELSWPRDDHRLTLRSTLPAAELERLRQLVR